MLPFQWRIKPWVASPTGRVGIIMVMVRCACCWHLWDGNLLLQAGLACGQADCAAGRCGVFGGSALWDRQRGLAAIAWASAAPLAGWQTVLCCGTVLAQQEQGCCVAIGQAAAVAGHAAACLAAAMPLRVVSSWNVVHSNVLCGGEVGQDLQHL